MVASDWIVTEITKDTELSDILRESGDIAKVMEVFGIKRVGGYSVRKFITKALTVERAAKIHRVPLYESLGHPPQGGRRDTARMSDGHVSQCERRRRIRPVGASMNRREFATVLDSCPGSARHVLETATGRMAGAV